jgi:hypothetical protein
VVRLREEKQLFGVGKHFYLFFQELRLDKSVPGSRDEKLGKKAAIQKAGRLDEGGDAGYRFDPGIFGGNREGDGASERVPADPDHLRIDPFLSSSGRDGGLSVLLLPDSVRMSSPAPADPSKVEFQPGQAFFPQIFTHRVNNIVEHVSAIQRVGMADHDQAKGARAFGDGDHAFQGDRAAREFNSSDFHENSWREFELHLS